MYNKKSKSGILLGMLAILGIVAIASCSELGKKYTAFIVTSEPSGALVYSLIDSGGSGGKFINDGLGITPTGEKIVYFAFGAPFAGDTKIGIRVHMQGYEAQDIFFEPGDWYETAEEARQHVREISVLLEPQSTSELDPKPQAEPQRDVENAIIVDAAQFWFNVPTTWIRLSKSEESELKRTMLGGANELLDTSKGSPEFDQFYAFESPEKSLVVINTQSIPGTMSGKEYMKELQAMNETKFEYGLRTGIVKRVNKVNLSEAEESSVLVSDYVATKGKNNRSLLYNITSNASSFAVTVTSFFPESDNYFHKSVEKVMESVRFGNRDAEITDSFSGAETQLKSCTEILEEWTTSDPDAAASAFGMNKESANLLGIGGRTIVPPNGCELLVEGVRVRPYCNGQPLSSESCDRP